MKTPALSPSECGNRFQAMVLVLVAGLVGLPLLFGRALAGHDIINYLIIAQQMAQNFREGLLFPAWAGGFNSGFGSPLLLFFPPLTGTVNAVPVLLGFRVIDGVCALALFAHLLSGLVFFGWQSSIGNRRTALPAAIVYMVAPYRLVDLYLRSALAEHWAFIWPPLILWIASSKRLQVVFKTPLLALAVAGLLMTNVPLAMLFGVGIAAWSLMSDRVRGQRYWLVSGAALGFGLSAFMLVPQFLASSLLSLSHCFGDASGRFRPSANTLFSAGFKVWNDNSLFSTVLVVTFVLAIIAFSLLKRGVRQERWARGAFAAAVICVGVTLGPVGPVWDALPGFSNLQFPWRITALVTLIAATMVGGMTPRRAWVFVIVSAACTVPFSDWNRTLPRFAFLPEKPSSSLGENDFPDPMTAWEAGSVGWYWRHHKLVELCLLPESMNPLILEDFVDDSISQFDFIRNRPAAFRGQPMVEIQVTTWEQVEREIRVSSTEDETLVWRVIPFPDMIVTVDGRKVELTSDPATSLLSHAIPGGDHVVRWTWRPFPSLQRARMISVAALLMVVGLLCGASFRGR